MAVVWGLRAAIILAPIGARIVQQASGPPAATWDRLTKAAWRRLSDPDEDDGPLSELVTRESGIVSVVATHPMPFTLRKAQLVWARDDSIPATVEDVAVTTHHFLKVAGGSPSDDWLAADFTAAETAFDNFWTAIKPQFHSSVRLSEIRWYKVVPLTVAQLEDELTEVTGPPVRAVTRNVFGSASAVPCPPQVACSVTEKGGSRAHWGRFYLPAPNSAACQSSGRWSSAFLTIIADAADAMYEAFLTANIPAAIYSRAKLERPKKPSGVLPAEEAVVRTVTDLQVDDLPDVVRSRRWKAPSLRVQRAVGS